MILLIFKYITSPPQKKSYKSCVPLVFGDIMLTTKESKRQPVHRAVMKMSNWVEFIPITPQETLSLLVVCCCCCKVWAGGGVVGSCCCKSLLNPPLPTACLNSSGEGTVERYCEAGEL